MTLIDQPGDVRASETLPIERLNPWLKQQIPSLTGAPKIRQFSGGASNLTYQLDYPSHTLILRRPPLGHVPKGAHDMLREAGIMQRLKPVFPWVPTIFAICHDADVIGAEFHVMEKLEGIIPRRELPQELSLSVDDTRQICTQVLDKLIALHQINYQQAELTDLGKGDGYVARQISGWSKRYRAARTANVPNFEIVMQWLDQHQPADVGTCIIHNDFRFDNVVLNANNPQEVIGVLDWELSTLGDPLMDLGSSLAYWVQADDDALFQQFRFQPTHLPGMLTRDEVVTYYLAHTNHQINDFSFYLVYGYFRLAGIVQQIYARYYQGATDNPRFANFDKLVCWLEQRCLTLIQQSPL